MRILVAEDDSLLAEGLMRTLRQSGYAVDWVKNGVEADCALDANEFDLLSCRARAHRHRARTGLPP